MNYWDLPSVLYFSAEALRKYAEFLKGFDDSEKDISDVSAIYDHIESFGNDFGRMTLRDFHDTLHRTYRHLDDFVFQLKEDDDPNWRGYELLMTVLWRFVCFLPMVR